MARLTIEKPANGAAIRSESAAMWLVSLEERWSS